jgi:hypothetical protein
MQCEACDGQIHAVIHEYIGHGWLHLEPARDRSHRAEPRCQQPLDHDGWHSGRDAQRQYHWTDWIQVED